jgi:hypothetical protein
MCPRRKNLDRIEAKRRNLEKMLPTQPLGVVQVSGHPELSFDH